MLFMRKTTDLPSAAEALPGRATPIPTATRHFVNGRPLQPPRSVSELSRLSQLYRLVQLD